MVTENGAEYRKDLTKTVTHLIAKNADGEKYKFATQWNTKVVTMKWVHDSLERGMILEESLYHPLLPPEKQGVGAWNRSASTIKDKYRENKGSSNPRPRKLRRIASAKLSGQNEGIWDDIVGSGFDGVDQNSNGNSQQKVGGMKRPRHASVIQEARSFASETTFTGPQETHSKSPVPPQANHSEGFLDGCYFLIHGFTGKQVSGAPSLGFWVILTRFRKTFCNTILSPMGPEQSAL